MYDAGILLQPFDVGLFSPLQKAYGDAVATHMKETRTGVAKGTFWAFYCAAQATAYTTSNIKSAWRATGIVPYNPNAVLTKLPGYKPHPRAVPKVPTTPHSFSFCRLLRTAESFASRPSVLSSTSMLILLLVVQQRSLRFLYFADFLTKANLP